MGKAVVREEEGRYQIGTGTDATLASMKTCFCEDSSGYSGQTCEGMSLCVFMSESVFL